MSACEQRHARPGQVWRDKYDYQSGNPSWVQPTLEVTESDGTPGGFAEGIRRPSGKKTRVRLDAKGRVRGYTLVKDAPAPAAEETTAERLLREEREAQFTAVVRAARPAPAAQKRQTSAALTLDWSRHADGCQYHEELCGPGEWHCAHGCPSKASAPQASPLAKVREALEEVASVADPIGMEGRAAAKGLAALAPLERALPDLMAAWHHYDQHVTKHDKADWRFCSGCAALLEGKS